MPLLDTDVERALVVGAHPDDIEFGCAGTVATWTRAGVAVTYLVCTRGDQGGFDDTPRADMPAIREAEQRAAGAAVGVGDVRFLDGYRDGWLEPTHELQRDITRVIRDVRPQRMLVQSPERWWDRLPASHPDHLAAGEASIRAVYPAARNPFAFPELLEEGLQPWTVQEVWLAADPNAERYVDVTDVVDRKVEAILAHVSQVRHREDEIEPMVKSWLEATAVRAGLGAGRYAEVFRVVATG